jgi:hypothetical protein
MRRISRLSTRDDQSNSESKRGEISRSHRETLLQGQLRSCRRFVLPTQKPTAKWPELASAVSEICGG